MAISCSGRNRTRLTGRLTQSFSYPPPHLAKVIRVLIAELALHLRFLERDEGKIAQQEKQKRHGVERNRPEIERKPERDEDKPEIHRIARVAERTAPHQFRVRG